MHMKLFQIAFPGLLLYLEILSNIDAVDTIKKKNSRHRSNREI